MGLYPYLHMLLKLAPILLLWEFAYIPQLSLNYSELEFHQLQPEPFLTETHFGKRSQRDLGLDETEIKETQHFK